ncbi:MAG TPA: 1-deoxy-D-xylulose-5-phosphate reductoisomerase [Rhizomicrobium sp.]|jgi:1-deoxy-D-xylulose-5-phosphate reductoisomerase|nr:1-deoxy-D-xylulose-5-phosphate reductoisomerase [Rhizomicrobium sp.]
MTPISRPRTGVSLPNLPDVLARSVTVLGSTGSVGVSTLDVISHARNAYGPDAMPVEAITAQRNVKKLVEQARAIKPKLAVIGDKSLYKALKDSVAPDVEVAAGEEAVIAAAARSSDIVLVAIVGVAGLAPALAAVKRGATVALANKECVVAAGDIFRAAVESSGAVIIPVDSEHNAAFQILDLGGGNAIERVTITASGGPFREWSSERMSQATPEQAVAHPNWSMGAKISVDSATLMNKGLELIEAHYLFGLPAAKLGVVIHPQSVVHCLVSYEDGSTLAHLSAPDMRTPIAHALAWPRRISSPSRRLGLTQIGQLSFLEPDLERFPCLKLAEDCLRTGGATPTLLNAANEVAVEAFLGRKLRFLDVSRVVAETLGARDTGLGSGSPSDLEAVLELDRTARRLARDACGRLAALA